MIGHHIDEQAVSALLEFTGMVYSMQVIPSDDYAIG
jgi:hypothetical protein